MSYIYKRKGSDTWYMSLQKNAKQHRICLKTTDEKQAKLMLKAAEAKVQSAAFLQRIHNLAYSDSDTDSTNQDVKTWAEREWGNFNPREKQAVLFVLFKGRCAYCRQRITIPLRREKRTNPLRCVLDHFIPYSASGSDALTNFVLACHACNMKKLDGHAP